MLLVGATVAVGVQDTRGLQDPEITGVLEALARSLDSKAGRTVVEGAHYSGTCGATDRCIRELAGSGDIDDVLLMRIIGVSTRVRVRAERYSLRSQRQTGRTAQVDLPRDMQGWALPLAGFALELFPDAPPATAERVPPDRLREDLADSLRRLDAAEQAATSPAMRATLARERAIVLSALGRRTEALLAFMRAVENDGSVALDATFTGTSEAQLLTCARGVVKRRAHLEAVIAAIDRQASLPAFTCDVTAEAGGDDVGAHEDRPRHPPPAPPERAVPEPAPSEAAPTPGAFGVLARLTIDPEARGAVFGAGGSWRPSEWLELWLAVLVGAGPGGFVGLSLHVPVGALHPVATVGVPLFIRDGAWPGVHGGIGAVWDLTDRLSVRIDVAVEHFPGTPPGFEQTLVLPTTAVSLRL